MNEINTFKFDNFLSRVGGKEGKQFLAEMENKLHQETTVSRDAKELSILSKKIVEDSKRDDVETYEKVLNLTESKSSLVSIKRNIQEVYDEYEGLAVDFSTHLEHINSLIIEGEQLKKANSLDLEKARLILTTKESPMDNMFGSTSQLVEVFADREQIIEQAILFLKQQVSEVEILKKSVYQPIERLDFISNEYLPSTIIQVSINLLMLKFELVEKINNDNLYQIDIGKVLNEVKKSNNNELILSEREAVYSNLNVMEETILSIRDNQTDSDFKFKKIMDHEIDKVLKLINSTKGEK